MLATELRKVLDCDGVVFLSYGGLLTQELIVGMTHALEKESEQNNMSIKNSINILTIFIEMSQNIMNYSKKNSNNSIQSDSKGLVFVGFEKENSSYYVCSQNLVSLSEKESIIPKIKEVQQLNRDELKVLYRKNRKAGKDKHNKGAGIGFIEIARRCDRIEYEFTQEKDDFSFFNLKAILTY